MPVKQKTIIALIPARAGSKGLQGKNMLKIKGVPLVGYTLQAALDSRFINKVYLSSDDEMILNYGKLQGATPIHRTSEYSSDTASANSVVEHFLDNVPQKVLKENPYIIYLQPTSPLRTSKHIDDAIMKMKEQKIDKLVSVNLIEKSLLKSFKVDENGNLQALFGEEITNQRRQDLPTLYLANGAIYIFLYSDFRERNAFPSNGSYPYIMDQMDSLDIDTKDDLLVFKKLIK